MVQFHVPLVRSLLPSTVPATSADATTAATTTTINPEYTAWVKQDQILLGWILSSLTEPVLAQVVGLETSYDVWNALQRHFASSSRSRIMQLRRELQLLKKGNKTMSEYFLCAKQLSDNLAACGHAITTSDLQQYILNGLDSAYDAIVTNLTATNDDITLKDFQAHLFSFDMRLESQNGILGAAPTANMAKSTSGSFRRANNSVNQQMPRSNNNVRASYGQHPNQQRTRSPPVANLSGPCQLCGRRNHTVINCWHRFDKDFTPDRPAPTAYVATSQPIHASTMSLRIKKIFSCILIMMGLIKSWLVMVIPFLFPMLVRQVS